MSVCKVGRVIIQKPTRRWGLKGNGGILEMTPEGGATGKGGKEPAERGSE